jgi:tetratricopeptide (TPR) repeat protein
MQFHDRFDLTLTTDNAAAVRAYDTALSSLLLLRNNPMVQAQTAIDLDANFVMAQVLKGVLCVLSTEKSLLPDAIAALAAGNALAKDANAREQRHLRALALWIDGRRSDACAQWETILVDEPQDALAMFASHQTDFFQGNAIELRDRVARRLPNLAPATALYGHYLAMHAFGLEEMGDYALAERAARTALEHNRQDAWAVHALVHVMEMTRRIDEGRELIDASASHWADDSFFAVHIWWHQALFYIAQRQWDEVLRLYDERLRGADSAVIMDLLDASALLWRLHLQGVSVGERWQRLCELWEPCLDDGWYAFNDFHAMMAFIGAGRDDLAQRLLAIMQQTAAGTSENAAITRRVGLPVAEALRAYGAGQFIASADTLTAITAIAWQAGGSHAQRDLLAQTLLAARARRAPASATARPVI